MNTPNNKRRKQSLTRITNVFYELMKTHELNEITVTEICRLAQVNRTTFYANFDDVYDLARKVLQSLATGIDEIYREEITQGFNSNDWLKLLRHIYQNQSFYKTCFKLGLKNLPSRQYDVDYAEKYYQNRHISYHIEFFRAGFNRIVEMWLEGGCKETPEEINDIILSEYKGKTP